MRNSPITRVQNSTATEKISPEFKKQIDSQFQEKVSPLREQRIKEVTAQVQPISAITPKQPINDNKVISPTDKKKEEPKGNFGDLLKDSLMEKEAKTCPVCKGKGTVGGEECGRCFGDKKVEEEKKASMNKEATIVEKNGKYCVESHTGKNLGCSDTREQALTRLHQVEYFKSHPSK